MKTQITTADNHINQDKTDKMKNLKCYLTHTCSASKPLPVTIVACVVHLPPLPSPASGPPGKKQPDNQLCRTTARRWAARGGQGGQKVQEFIPGKRGPVLVKVSLHSFAVIVHGRGRGGRGILAGRNAAMQNTNHRDGKHCRGCNLFESAWLV